LSAPTTFDGLLSTKQIESIAYAKQAKIALWSGAVSSGKTIASLISFLGAVAVAPQVGLLVVVGKTLQTIERNLVDPLQSPELFGPFAAQVHHTPGSNSMIVLGRTVHLVGAADARAEGRIRGSTVALAYVDEATLIPQSFWMMLLSRLRVPGARLLATTNPDGPAHWLRRDFILRAAEVNMIVFQFRLADNPSLTREYIRDLEAQYVGLWKRRYLDGEWCMAEGAIFDAYDPTRHILRGPLPRLLTYPGVGVDYGTTNAFSAHLLGVQYDNTVPARLVLAREYRHDPRHAQVKLTDADYSVKLRQWISQSQPPQWVAVDPSAASFKLQLFRDGLSNVIDANNDVLNSIRLAASLLASDRLVIHESCTGLLEELPGYSWDPAAAERGIDAPIKVADHGIDSGMRYSISSTETLWRGYIPLMFGKAAAA
jgi:PBSX family phage terminase large subunit